MPFNEKNLKQLFEQRITAEDLKELGQKRMLTLSFCVKEERNGVVREVKDATGIEHKTLELVMKQFEYLANSDYVSAAQKAELRQQAIEQGLLPREAQVQGQTDNKISQPPKGTYS